MDAFDVATSPASPANTIWPKDSAATQSSLGVADAARELTPRETSALFFSLSLVALMVTILVLMWLQSKSGWDKF